MRRPRTRRGLLAQLATRLQKTSDHRGNLVASSLEQAEMVESFEHHQFRPRHHGMKPSTDVRRGILILFAIDQNDGALNARRDRTQILADNLDEDGTHLTG